MSALRFPNSSHRTQGGFTLVELVVVIVLLSIIAVIGSSFVVNSVDSYRKSTAHSQLVQQTRQALERSSRELRHALPNSIRISTNHRCIEWLPVVGVGRYKEQLAGNTTATLTTTPITVSLANAHYMSIAGLSPDELYGVGALALKPLPSEVALGSTVSSIGVNSTTPFLRDSVARRVFLLGKPKQLCVANGRLTLHENYTTTSFPADQLSDVPPNTGVLLAQGIVLGPAPFFQLESSSQVRNSIVMLELSLQHAGQQIALQHKAMVRNVP